MKPTKVPTFDARQLGADIGIDWPSSLFDVADLRKGIEVEWEHAATVGGDLHTVAKIARDHLLECPDYYQRLEPVEKACKQAAHSSVKIPSPGWGKSYGGTSYLTDQSVRVWLHRKGQRVRFYDADGKQVGPEQSNVAPALAYASRNKWIDVSDVEPEDIDGQRNPSPPAHEVRVEKHGHKYTVEVKIGKEWVPLGRPQTQKQDNASKLRYFTKTDEGKAHLKDFVAARRAGKNTPQIDDDSFWWLWTRTEKSRREEKRTKSNKNFQAFQARVREILAEVGAQSLGDEHYVIQSPFGPWHVHLYDNWVATRFDNAELASKHVYGVNSYTGKFNFHYYEKANLEMAEDFGRVLKSVMARPKANPSHPVRGVEQCVGCGTDVVIKRKRQGDVLCKACKATSTASKKAKQVYESDARRAERERIAQQTAACPHCKGFGCGVCDPDLAAAVSSESRNPASKNFTLLVKERHDRDAFPVEIKANSIYGRLAVNRRWQSFDTRYGKPNDSWGKRHWNVTDTVTGLALTTDLEDLSRAKEIAAYYGTGPGKAMFDAAMDPAETSPEPLNALARDFSERFPRPQKNPFEPGSLAHVFEEEERTQSSVRAGRETEALAQEGWLVPEGVDPAYWQHVLAIYERAYDFLEPAWMQTSRDRQRADISQKDYNKLNEWVQEIAGPSSHTAEFANDVTPEIQKLLPRLIEQTEARYLENKGLVFKIIDEQGALRNQDLPISESEYSQLLARMQHDGLIRYSHSRTDKGYVRADAKEKENPASDVRIGRSWMSPRGERRIVQAGTHPVTGENILGVSTAGSTIAEMIRESEIDSEIARDTKNYESRRAAQATASAEKQSKASHDSWQGFTDSMRPERRGRVVGALSKHVGVGGSFDERGRHVERLVASGYTVRDHPKFKRVLSSPDGTFYTEKDLTSTALDYAIFLTLKQNPALSETQREGLDLIAQGRGSEVHEITMSTLRERGLVSGNTLTPKGNAERTAQN